MGSVPSDLVMVYQSGLGARGVGVEARLIQLSDEPRAVSFEAFYDSAAQRPSNCTGTPARNDQHVVV